MLLRKSVSLESTIRSSDITPQHVFEQYHTNRRRFLAGAATLGAGALGARYIPGLIDPPTAVHAADQVPIVPGKYTLQDAQTPISKSANYNNFYEFGTEKSDPAKYAHTMTTHPWPIQI